MTLKFMRQEKGESVNIFYGRIRDVLHQCEYDPKMQNVLEAETLKHGLTNSKIIEKVYALPKEADANRVLDTVRAEEQAQMHISEEEKIRRDHNLGETKSAEELGKQKKPSSKKSKASSDGHTKNQYNCTRCGRKHGPGKCPAYRKEYKRKGHFAEQCVTRKTLVLTARDLAKGNKNPDPRRSFTKQLQTPKVAKQTSQEYDTDEVTVQVYSVEAKAEETKSTHFAKKLPKHVTKVI